MDLTTKKGIYRVELGEVYAYARGRGVRVGAGEHYEDISAQQLLELSGKLEEMARGMLDCPENAPQQEQSGPCEQISSRLGRNTYAPRAHPMPT